MNLCRVLPGRENRSFLVKLAASTNVPYLEADIMLIVDASE